MLKEADLALSSQYKRYLEVISNLLEDKSGPVRKTVKLELELERNLCRLFTMLGFPEQGPKKSVAQKTKIHPEFQDRLIYFQGLLWCLQMQPAYFARLGTRLGLVDAPASELALWFRVVRAVFSDLSNTRVRTLFKALLRRVATYELTTGVTKRIEHIFLRGSRTANLLSYFVCHKDQWSPAMNHGYIEELAVDLPSIGILWITGKGGNLICRRERS